MALRQLADLAQLAIVSYLPCFSPLPNNHGFYYLPNYKLLDRDKLKAFADDKLNDGVMMISAFHTVENHGKEENAGFPTLFSKALFFRVLKVWNL